jgi:hypothetical protein
MSKFTLAVTLLRLTSEETWLLLVLLTSKIIRLSTRTFFQMMNYGKLCSLMITKSNNVRFINREMRRDITYNVPNNTVQLLNGERLSSDTLGRLDRTIVCDETLQVELPDGRTEEFSSDLIIDAKLRQFYTFFCLKEAYIKLVGEGLLAPWIRECEFKNVHPPTAGTVARCSTIGSWGGKSTGGRSAIKSSKAKQANVFVPAEEEEIEIWLNGEEVHDVITEVQAFEENFMIASMIRPSTALGSKAEFPPWEKLVNLERDILAVAVNSAIETAMEASFWESFYSAVKPEPPLVAAVENIQLEIKSPVEQIASVQPSLTPELYTADCLLTMEPSFPQELYGSSKQGIPTVTVVEEFRSSSPDYAAPAGPVDIFV